MDGLPRIALRQRERSAGRDALSPQHERPQRRAGARQQRAQHHRLHVAQAPPVEVERRHAAGQRLTRPREVRDDLKAGALPEGLADAPPPLQPQPAVPGAAAPGGVKRVAIL